MLRKSIHTSARRLSSHAHSAIPRSRVRGLFLVSSSAIVAGALWYNSHDPIHNDAPPLAETSKLPTAAKRSQKNVSEDGALTTLIWGSNKSHILDPSSAGSSTDSIKTPEAAEWLRNVALRDLALHERHAACVDAKGDVYQWGDGFNREAEDSSSPNKPALTLRGKNITQLQLTKSRVFALSASGRIYVLAASAAQQELPTGVPTPSSTPWWGTGWMWGEEEAIDFSEIIPNEKLNRSERFVSIAAGQDHLLALTSAGRTFAHPITANANSHGQLGFRKFDLPARRPGVHLSHLRVPVELTPKAIADPYAKANRSMRRPPTTSEIPGAETSQNVVDWDDNDIRFSDRLFEIPALKGVHVEQIAAGGRSSFARAHGRVLGWGANEYGQIGLGGAVTLDTITVPTEIILWRSTPQIMRTKCLDVYAGGDLTFFKAERTDGSALPYIDVLACGNGQWGGLGNALYSNAQGNPVRAKNVSGLLEYSERTNNLQPIYPYAISVSPTGHVLLTLDTLARSGSGGRGRDLVAWGANYEYQLGNGKRGSLPTPTALHMPDGIRFMLGRVKAAEVRDMSGAVWKRGIEVEQRAVAGWGNSVVYWRIC